MFALFVAATSAAGQTYVVRSGDTLEKIAADFYGSATYDKVIQKHNKLGSSKEVTEGKTLLVPSLDELLTREGLGRDVQSDIDLVLKARYTYMIHRNELLKAITPGNSKGKITVPIKIRQDLMEAAKNLVTAAKSLAKRGNFFDAPVRMRRELMFAALNLRKLARGNYKKEYDEAIHKRMSSAFYFGIVWARDEEGNYHKIAH